MAVKEGDSTRTLLHDLERQLAEAQDRTKEAIEELAVARETGAAQEFGDALQELIGDREPPPGLARQAALEVASELVWSEHLGPSLSATQIAEALGISRQRVYQLASDGGLIALEGEGRGAMRFPAFQVHRGAVLEPLIAAWALMCESVSSWTAASWCVSAHPELDGVSPREWAAHRRDPELLAGVSRRDAARLAR